MRREVVVQNARGFMARRPSFTGSDLAAVGLTAAGVAAWVQAAGGTFSFRALLACEAIFFAFYLVGSLFAAWPRLAAGVSFGLPLRLLVGYAVVNTALFALAWLSPLGTVANFGIIAAVAVALFVAARPIRKVSGADSGDGGVGYLVLALSLVAATLWSQDSLQPPLVDDRVVVFKPWIDSFYHAVHLRIFGAAHGASSIEDFRLAGVAARPYHYAAYMTPAFIKQASGIASCTAFAGILEPLGVFLTGLGAYVLIDSFWGTWPALAGCAALLALPDGAQQGMQNPFMSYHWLTLISPTATPGLALVALAWLFVLRGCAQGNRAQVLVGWGAAALLVVYKAHFFIASALLLLLVPAAFFRGKLSVRKRVLCAAAAVAAYAVTIASVRNLPGLPLIRFDGSSVREVMGLVARFTKPGALRDLIVDRIGPDSPLRSNLLVGTPFVLLAALGVFAPALILVALRLRQRTPTAALLVTFPFLILTNFLAMFLGLALDMRSSTPDELSQRPIMIVYFVVVAWVGGATGLLWLESRRAGWLARPGIVALAVGLLAGPAVWGAGIHRMWAMPSISPPLRIPVGLVRSAEYIRDHGAVGDLFQDSQFDRFCVVAALSDRRSFASRSQTRIDYNVERVEERANAIDRLMGLRDAREVSAAARGLGVRWFLLEPGDRIDWPAEVAARPAFELDGYRVYRF